MLYMHEVHEVVGAKQAEFESAYREGWMPALAQDGDARLLWYFNHAMGSGPSYHVVTITGIRDGDAWDRLTARMIKGDLRDWVRGVDELRYRATGKMLQPVRWSPIQDVDLESVPTDGSEHELSIYMEDTGWPDVPLDDYTDYWNDSYFQIMSALPNQLLDIQACFQTGIGSHLRPEAMLMQKIINLEVLRLLLTSTEEYDPNEWPGSYMHGALKLRDQWESRLLRTSKWSPFH